MNSWKPHPSEEVTAALIRLNDALCQWERNTGQESILILRQANWGHRSINGKPLTGISVSEITDQQMLDMLGRNSGQNPSNPT